ncbi:hypothetical protein SOVF_113650 [Spinacia oleracea]|nr:hypothetical protein SOVF_113650 [Spinacia oleracea]
MRFTLSLAISSRTISPPSFVTSTPIYPATRPFRSPQDDRIAVTRGEFFI